MAESGGADAKAEGKAKVTIPILFLKTKSTPKDNYEEYFASLSSATAASTTDRSNEEEDAQVQQEHQEYEYTSTFVPVFEHSIREKELAHIKSLILDGAFQSIAASPLSSSSRPQIHSSSAATLKEDGQAEHQQQQKKDRYGGLIFTSQRAVEPFARLIDELRAATDSSSLNELLPPETKIYSVGPATTRALKAIGLACPVLGEHTGNGEKLADFILEDYHSHGSSAAGEGSSSPSEADGRTLLPLLFVIGEQHRDIIPRKLQSAQLPLHQRIQVDELVVYETKVMESFAADFAAAVDDAVGAATTGVNGNGEAWIWIVIFSPNGCRAMLETLDLLVPDDSASKSVGATATAMATALQEAHQQEQQLEPQSSSHSHHNHDRQSQKWWKWRGDTQHAVCPYIVTIGPTTRDYLKREFGIEPHVSAARPSPDGLAERMLRFQSELVRPSLS